MPAGYTLLPSGYYRQADGAGPYAWDGSAFSLLSGDAGAAAGSPAPATHRLLAAGYYRLAEGAGPYGWDGTSFFLLSGV
jgi:hypothetical protein